MGRSRPANPSGRLYLHWPGPARRCGGLCLLRLASGLVLYPAFQEVAPEPRTKKVASMANPLNPAPRKIAKPSAPPVSAPGCVILPVVTLRYMPAPSPSATSRQEKKNASGTDILLKFNPSRTCTRSLAVVYRYRQGLVLSKGTILIHVSISGCVGF